MPVALLGRPYPGNPRGFASAVQQYAQGDIPVAMYPRRMLMDKYKTPPVQPRFGDTARGAAMAGWQPSYPWSPDQMVGGHTSGPAPMIPPGVPAVDAARFAHTRGLARMPQPSDNMSVNFRAGYQPLDRGVWPANETVTAQTVTRFIDTTQPIPARDDRTTQAMAAVSRTRQEYRRMLTEEQERPWFLVAPQ